MSAGRKLLLIYTEEVYADQDPAPQSLARHREQLVLALRAHGAEVEELGLATDPEILLDRLDAGAVPVVIKGGR